MGKSKKKIDVFSIVIFSVLALSIVMAVVGICIAWTATTVKVADLLGGASKTTTSKLSEIAEANSKLVNAGSDPMEGYGVMSAFAYITLALSVVTTLVFVISKFAKVKVLKWVLIAVAALTVVSAIVAIATTYSFCGKYAADFIVGDAKTVPAAGAWLLAIFGIVGGAAGVAGALKK